MVRTGTSTTAHASDEAPALPEISAAVLPRAPRPDGSDWPVAPTEAEWAAMTAPQQAQVVARLEAWLSSGALDFMAEGPTHFRKKSQSLDRLQRYFSGGGRRIFVAAEMGVYYPGEKVIVPDVMAVLDAGPPRGESWFVSIEGKGPHWALEIHVAGDWHKDSAVNVEKYARLGIAEYFVFDYKSKQLYGHRLPQGGRTYQKVRPRLGRLRSEVLGLDLAIVEGDLCFFQDSAQLLDSDELIAQLQGMVDDLSVKAQDEQEGLRLDLQREQEERLRELSHAFFSILAARGLAVPDELRALVATVTDPAPLAAWLPRAAVCKDAAELLPDRPV